MFRMAKQTKHKRKLRKKAEKLKRDLATHPEAQKWDMIEVIPYQKKVKIVIERINTIDYPQRKQAIIGLKDNLQLDRFLGRFQNQ